MSGKRQKPRRRVQRGQNEQKKREEREVRARVINLFFGGLGGGRDSRRIIK